MIINNNNYSVLTGGKMKMKLVAVLSVILIIAFNTKYNAQNFNDALRLSEPEILTSARALGMGNAFSSISNDFSASLFNPAGFALIKKSQFESNLQYNSFKNESNFFNKITNYSNTATKFNQFGFSFPFPTSRGSFVVGFGYNQIKDFNRAVKFSGFNGGNYSLIQNLTSDNDDIAYDLGLSYPVYDSNNKYLNDETKINGKLNQSGNILQDGALNSWVFSSAIEIQQDIFVGVSVNVINGDFKRNREYWENDSQNIYPISVLLDSKDPYTADFQSFYLNDIIRWDISGWNTVVGIIGKIDESISAGLTIKLPKAFDIRETYFVDGHASFGTGKTYSLDPPIENRVEYEIKTPFEFTGSASYSLSGITFSLDATFIDYSRMEFADGFYLSDREKKNREIISLFTDVLNLNAGVEYVLPGTGIAIRGGFILMPSPYRDDPSEYDKKYLTAGLGFIGKGRFSIDLAYAYGWWKDYGDNYGTNLSRFYQDISKSNLLIGIKYKI